MQLTTGRVPVSGQLQQACALPLVAVVQPFAPLPPSPVGQEPAPLAASQVARCSECLAYINHLCPFNASGWACSLCGTQNDFAAAANRRYMGGGAARAALSELRGAAIEAAEALYDVDSSEGGVELFEAEAQPVCVALVDTSGGPEFQELVRSALLAALEALPAAALFGVVGVGGGGVQLYEPCSAAPCVRHVSITVDGAGPTAVDLADALPLQNLLAPLATAKAAAAAAVEALAPAAGGSSVERPLGEALQAVLRYLGSGGGVSGDDGSPGLVPGARLLVFLSGAPNDGKGSVVRPAAGVQAGRSDSSAEASTSAHPAPFLLDPFFPELTSWGAQGMTGPVTAAAEPAAEASKHSSSGEAWLQRQRARGSGGGGTNGTLAAGGWRAAAEAAAALDPVAAELGLAPGSLRINWAAERFYEEAGAAAAALGICVDVFAAGTNFFGLELLRPLATSTGGALLLCSSLAEDECALPQDVYKRLTEPTAFGCLLRLRTSPELRVVGSVGSRLVADQQFADLYRLPCCHPHDAFALELEHSARSGFASRSTPVLQLVMQYTRLAPSQQVPPHAMQQQPSLALTAESPFAPSAGGAAAAFAAALAATTTPERFVLQRRVRVLTVSFPVARSPAQVYASADAPTLAFALLQQAGLIAAGDGIETAQSALADWLSALTAAYHECVTLGEYQQQGTEPGAAAQEVDPSFAAVEALQQVPRLTYALIHGPLLVNPTSNSMAGAQAPHPDATAALRTLWETLPPAELAAAIYPQLSSWASPDDLAFPRHSLSRAAVLLSSQPIYLLDTYTELIIFYTRAAQAAGLRFPPPHGSALRAHVAAVRQARRLTPRLVVAREGDEGEGSTFFERLVEDAPHEAGAPPFVRFLADVRREAEVLLGQR